MLRKVTHCAGRVLANTRSHQLHWGDREMKLYIMHKMQSGGWPYSKIGRDSSKAPSLRAAVLCAAVLRAAVFHLMKILHSDHNH